MPYNKWVAKRRWTVGMMKVYRRFCGWETLLRLVDAVDFDLRGFSGERLIHDEVERDMARALIATVFECGARICEVIGGSSVPGLRAGDVTVLGDRVQVVFNIEKRYRKRQKVTKFRAIDGSRLRWTSREEAEKSGRPYEPYVGYLTDRVVEIRNIVFPKWEPLAPIMLGWMERVKADKGLEAKLFNISYNKAYRIIRRAGEKIGEDFPPHRLRAERATQLVLEYGFNDFELTEWFMWKSSEIARNYTTLAPRIIEKMFVKVY
jgi:hypothetical protein